MSKKYGKKGGEGVCEGWEGVASRWRWIGRTTMNGGWPNEQGLKVLSGGMKRADTRIEGKWA